MTERDKNLTAPTLAVLKLHVFKLQQLLFKIRQQLPLLGLLIIIIFIIIIL